MRRLSFVAAIVALSASPALAADCKPLQRYAVIPFETDESYQVYIRSTVNGRPALMMLDTGAYWSMLSRQYAEAQGFSIGNSVIFPLRDVNGELMNKMTSGDFKLGSANFGKTEFFIGGFGGEINGLVGQNLLAKVDLEIDNANKTISLFSQDHCRGDGVHWADEAVTLTYKRAVRAPIGSNIRKQENKIDMPIVGADIDGEAVTMLVDTGATYTVMDLEYAKRKFNLTTNSPGVTAAGKLVGANGGGSDSYSYTFSTLTISGIKFENVPIRLSRLESTDMLLGMNELKKLRLYFASKDGMIHVTSADAKRGQ